MSDIDRLFEQAARGIARRFSRRNVLAKLGISIAGAAAFPALPVARGEDGAAEDEQPTTDSLDCNYWRYCAIDGYLCGCCGGSMNTCPPGTEMSPVTWIGTCRNPDDGVDYIVSYNDCCGKSTCNRCFCSRSEGEMPVYLPAKSGHINWCIGTKTNVYHCSTAIVIGKSL